MLMEDRDKDDGPRRGLMMLVRLPANSKRQSL